MRVQQIPVFQIASRSVLLLSAAEERSEVQNIVAVVILKFKLFTIRRQLHHCDVDYYTKD